MRGRKNHPQREARYVVKVLGNIPEETANPQVTKFVIMLMVVKSMYEVFHLNLCWLSYYRPQK